MRTLARYTRLFGVQLRASALLSLQYRSDFVIEGALDVFWAVTALLPLVVVFRDRASVAGWSFGEALVVTGWFTFLEGILEGAINPSLTIVVEHVRKGTLDFVLLKPADAQFLVSTARFQPWRALNVATAIAIFVVAFRRLGHAPTIAGVALSAALLAASITILYALWILAVSAAFYVVRVDNMTFLFSSIFDAARWPSSVFRGAVRIFFTFVVPIAVMTTYPAEALLGRIEPLRAIGALAFSALFALVARVVWTRSIARYTSASS